MSTPAVVCGYYEKPLTLWAQEVPLLMVLRKREKGKGILWSHVCGVGAKEDELHRKRAHVSWTC